MNNIKLNGYLERAREVPKNKGEGFPGLDLNSGWNWTPTKYGWLGSSTICNISKPNINTATTDVK